MTKRPLEVNKKGRLRWWVIVPEIIAAAVAIGLVLFNFVFRHSLINFEAAICSSILPALMVVLVTRVRSAVRYGYFYNDELTKLVYICIGGFVAQVAHSVYFIMKAQPNLSKYGFSQFCIAMIFVFIIFGGLFRSNKRA